jgi:hypothetical protein
MTGGQVVLPAPLTERAQRRIVERLRAAGVHLPDAALEELADAVLVDALEIAVAWLERE